MSLERSPLDDELSLVVGQFDLMSTDNIKEYATSLAIENYLVHHYFSGISHADLSLITDFFQVEREKGGDFESLMRRIVDISKCVKKLSVLVRKERIVMERFAKEEPICFERLMKYRKNNYQEESLGEYSKGLRRDLVKST